MNVLRNGPPTGLAWKPHLSMNAKPSVEQSTAAARRRYRITTQHDMLEARQGAREMTLALGFAGSRAAVLATVVSELARNILLYAGRGNIDLQIIQDKARVGLTIIAEDRGPGIANRLLALTAGYSTSGGLGLGLPGVAAQADEFELVTAPGEGVRVRAAFWR